MIDRVVWDVAIGKPAPYSRVKPGEIIHFRDPQLFSRWIGVQPNGEFAILDDEDNPSATPYDPQKGWLVTPIQSRPEWWIGVIRLRGLQWAEDYHMRKFGRPLDVEALKRRERIA